MLCMQKSEGGMAFLGRKELRALDINQYCTICCVEGAAWVTAPGRFCDYILKAGESLSLRGKGKILISGGSKDCMVRIDSK